MCCKMKSYALLLLLLVVVVVVVVVVGLGGGGAGGGGDGWNGPTQHNSHTLPHPTYCSHKHRASSQVKAMHRWMCNGC